VNAESDFTGAFAGLATKEAGALVVCGPPFFNSAPRADEVIE
jgi:hypothetical protein